MPTFSHEPVRVHVPATSANLGPGFEALGLAMAHYDEIEVKALGAADVSVQVTGEGAGELPGDNPGGPAAKGADTGGSPVDTPASGAVSVDPAAKEQFEKKSDMPAVEKK